MLKSAARIAAVVTCATLADCSIIPDLPPDSEMPVQEIMLHATCELRDAFLNISQNPRLSKFSPGEWAINITLTPRVDTQLQATFGYTGKSTIDKAALRFFTWTLGTSPGLRGDIEGHRDGAVTFPIKSAQLLNPAKYPLTGCEGTKQNADALSQYLGVAEWLARIIPQDETGLPAITHVDKPSYSTQIVVKLDAGGVGMTFFVPNGATYSPALFGLRKRDLTLSITLTPDPKKQIVQTYPDGAIRTFRPPAEGVSSAAQSRLDQISLERSIQNLRLPPE